jgi:hypothetical protein
VPDDGTKTVQGIKELLRNKKRYLSNDIPFIASNYYFLVETITKLESGKISIYDSVGLMEETRIKLGNVTCAVGAKVLFRFNEILENNPDWKNIKNINNILNKRQNDIILPDNILPVNIIYYKHCILVSVDCERTFSRYKNLLRDNRRSFIFDNIRKHVIINCNRNI